MQRTSFWLVSGAFLLAASAGPAYAANQSITCNGSTPGQLNALMIGGTVNSGDTVTITGICVGDTFAFPGMTFTNHNNSASLSATDGIQGMLTINGNGAVTTNINGLTLEGAPSDNGDQANLHISGGASVNLTNSEVKSAQRDGIDLDSNSSLTLQNTLIDGNGVANVSQHNNGIRIKKNAVLSDISGSANSVIENNAGFGIYAQGAAYIELGDTNMTSDTLSEIDAFGTYINLGGGTITATGALQAIQALAASSVTVVGVTISGPSGGVLVSGASSLLLVHATISTTSATTPAVEATGTSSVVITGGDTITASSGTGTAIEVDHSSSLMHQPISKLDPGSSNAAESITGAGLVQVQSSMDLGQGLVSASPGISWTTGSSGISVQQNSSFRVSGGVSITGAVTITQGSNGFANTANGGTNAITSTSCPFTNVPSSHWASPAKVTPAVPSATSYASAVSPQCLAF